MKNRSPLEMAPSSPSSPARPVAAAGLAPHPAPASKAPGFTLIELLVTIAIVGILSAMAVPQLLGAREKAKASACDAIFVDLAGELANGLDTQLNSGGHAFEAVNEIDSKYHDISLNPRTKEGPTNRAHAIFLVVNEGQCESGYDAIGTPCQVFMCPLAVGDRDEIYVAQRPRPGADLRTYTISND